MSQSPVGQITEQSAMPYRLGWRALNRLLHEDRAFSGNERHCAFLNQGDGTFADISAASGFDFKEDGRAIAYTDWDFDGDLDVWLTSRTAPRLRLLQNNSPPHASSASLSVLLVGTSPRTNRDAVGARAELYLAGSDTPLIRTLHAGHHFLSQSSAWLHFGLGSPTAEIEKLIVRWPAADPETFTGLTAGKRYTLTQATGAATPWPAPQGRAPLTASPLPEIDPGSTQRIVLANRLPLPAIYTASGPLPLPARPTLVNLWSATCLDCRDELSALAADAGKLAAAGLAVIALGTDHLDPDSTADTAAFLKSTGFPFPSHQPTSATVQTLDFFQQAQLDRWLPLPVPSSFLVDSDGAVAAIYKGKVDPATLIADLALLDAPAASLRSLATPFQGTWNTSPPPPVPGRVSTLLLDYNLADQAVSYLQTFIASPAARLQGNSALASTHFTLGTLYASQENHAAAIPALNRALALAPDDQRIRPTLANTHFNYALSLQDAGDFPQAIENFKQTLRNNPKLYAAANHLARIFACHPDAALRSGPESLALATRLCAITQNRNPALLDTLAAAQAETGDFTAAALTATSAINLLRNSPDNPEATRLLKAITNRLELYRTGTPFREPGWK